MDASHPSRPLGRIMTALCAAVVLFAGAINVAGAQTIPAAQTAQTASSATTVADAQPAPATNTAPAATPSNPDAASVIAQTATPKPAPKPPPPLSHMPVIDFVLTYTQPAYYGSNANIKGYDPIDLGGTVRFPITRKLNLFFDRITEGPINQGLECVIQPPGGRLCSSDTRDIILQYHATYAFNRFLTMDVGDSFRHRIWSSGGNGVSTVPFLCNNSGQSTGANCTVSSTEHHFAYLGFSYTTKPIAELLHSTFVLSLTGDAQNVDHHVGIVCSVASRALGANCTNLVNGQVGFIDQNPRQSVYYETTQGISMIVPVDPKHGTSLLLNERWGALNFYENAGFSGTTAGAISAPYRWNTAFLYQLSKRFSPGFTLALRHTDYHAIPQGAPFLFPNAIHVGSWDVISTFHVDTNTFFH